MTQPIDVPLPTVIAEVYDGKSNDDLYDGLVESVRAMTIDSSVQPSQWTDMRVRTLAYGIAIGLTIAAMRQALEPDTGIPSLGKLLNLDDDEREG